MLYPTAPHGTGFNNFIKEIITLAARVLKTRATWEVNEPLF
jgi:hypothetical protein